MNSLIAFLEKTMIPSPIEVTKQRYIQQKPDRSYQENLETWR